MRCGIAVLALAGVGCRSEFVIGVLEQHASDGSSTSDATSTGGSTMVASETSSDGDASTSSSTGPSCVDDDSGEPSDTTGMAPTCMASGHGQCDHLDNDPFHALGLDCSGSPISAMETLGDPTTLAVVTRFGADGNEHWVPREGSKLGARIGKLFGLH